MDEPKTLEQAVNLYSDPKTCLAIMVGLRWPGGIPSCPKCGSVNGDKNHYWLESWWRWKCWNCRHQFSVKSGTYMQDSPVSLSNWLVVRWACSRHPPYSSYSIAKALGITQVTAWRMMKRLRNEKRCTNF